MTPRQIQKQIEREKAHANRMNTPMTLSRYDYDSRERIYVKGWDHDHDIPMYTTDKKEAMKFNSYDEAKYFQDHVEYYAGGDEVYIHKA